MTDPSELIEHLELTFTPGCGCSRCGLGSGAADMLRTIAAERDAALKQVRSMATDALIDQNQAVGAYAKPAAPTGETVRVRIAVWLCQGVLDEVCILENVGSDYKPHAIVTADIPIPQPAEVAGTVEVGDG
ncbi:MAG: hypothetical protein PHU06_06315 [Gallionella sp.]|nr:hypothetical protein [Gallionella sp.]MDD4958420.1 hypothetical protein [Gallionella sp.]